MPFLLKEKKLCLLLLSQDSAQCGHIIKSLAPVQSLPPLHHRFFPSQGQRSPFRLSREVGSQVHTVVKYAKNQ